MNRDDYGRSRNPIRKSIRRLNKYVVGDVFEDCHRAFSISCASRTGAWTLLLELGRIKLFESFIRLHRFCLCQQRNVNACEEPGSIIGYRNQ